MSESIIQGKNCIIGKNVSLGENVQLGHNVIIEDDVIIANDCFIDSNTIIRSKVSLGEKSNVGSNCILGEYGMDFYANKQNGNHTLTIGKNALIRSGTIIYIDSKIGSNFQTGHRVTIREKSQIGNHVSIGTLSDVQGSCIIGNYVRTHSNVHIAQLSVIDDFAWLFPYVVLTNDPTPPSEELMGVHVKSFAIIATGAIIMPGLEIGQDVLVGAGAIVTKSVSAYSVVAGNPAKKISDVRNIKNKITGEAVYPWRHHYNKYMPWENSDFDVWYNGLDLETKEKIGIDRI